MTCKCGAKISNESGSNDIRNEKSSIPDYRYNAGTFRESDVKASQNELIGVIVGFIARSRSRVTLMECRR